MTIQQQERRALNEGIEDVFIETGMHSANIRTYYEIRIGVIKESFEKFYFNLAWLIELTEGLEELKNEQAVIEEVNNWLDKSDEQDMKTRCDTGRAVFKKFKSAMSAKGLLSLPSRGR